MGNDRFSRRGEPPTDFELQLLRAAAGDNAWLDIARSLIADHGAVAGAAALLTVLDALGTEKVHVPTREFFFRRLYRAERDRVILEQLQAPGATAASVATVVNVSPSRVRQLRAAKRSGRRYRAKPVCNRA